MVLIRRISLILLSFSFAGTALLAAGCAPIELPSVSALPVPVIPSKAPSLDAMLNRGGGAVGVLLMGSDKRPQIPGERSDAIMYVLISQRKSKMLIISFPRDSYMLIPGRRRDRINSALTTGGPELAARTVEQYLGLPVDYYVLADFPSFERVVDSLGGVPVTLKSSLRDRWARADLPAGTSRLSGAQALSLARARHSVPGGDFGRAANQQRIVLAAAEEFVRNGSSGEFSSYVSLMKTEFRTDMPVSVALSLARAVRKIPEAHVEARVLSGSTGLAGRASVVFLNNSEAGAIAARAKRDFGIKR